MTVTAKLALGRSECAGIVLDLVDFGFISSNRFQILYQLVPQDSTASVGKDFVLGDLRVVRRECRQGTLYLFLRLHVREALFHDLPDRFGIVARSDGLNEFLKGLNALV